MLSPAMIRAIIVELRLADDFDLNIISFQGNNLVISTQVHQADEGKCDGA